MTAAHSGRAHAKLAPSASYRWLNCPGSVPYEDHFEDRTSEFAAEGTAAHELVARCLEQGWAPGRFIGWWIDIDGENGKIFHEAEPDDKGDTPRWFEVTVEMCDAVEVMLDAVRDIIARYPDAEVSIEERLDMTHIHPLIFGTGDVTIYVPSIEKLFIVDYKHGKGVVVEVKGNKQLRLYSVGAAKRYHNRPLATVEAVIVQPRAPHKDGPVRSETFDLIELMEFEAMVYDGACRTDDARLDLQTMTWAVWTDTYLDAGPWCGFCKAQADCPVARANALAIARAEFGEDGELVLQEPETLTPDEQAAVLEQVSILKGWVKAVEERAHQCAVEGAAPTGFKLVDKRAIRKWKDADETRQTFEPFLGGDIYAAPKMLSPAQLEKKLGKKAFAELAEGLWVQTPSGTNLAPVDDPRPARMAGAADEFENVE